MGVVFIYFIFLHSCSDTNMFFVLIVILYLLGHFRKNLSLIYDIFSRHSVLDTFKCVSRMNSLQLSNHQYNEQPIMRSARIRVFIHNTFDWWSFKVLIEWSSEISPLKGTRTWKEAVSFISCFFSEHKCAGLWQQSRRHMTHGWQVTPRLSAAPGRSHCDLVSSVEEMLQRIF